MCIRDRLYCQEPLPSFEEAISVPNSPQMSPIGTPQVHAAYDPDELSIHQLMLSRATTHNTDDPVPQSANSLSTRRYSNIDALMGNSYSTSRRASASNPPIIFKNAFVDSGTKYSSSMEHGIDSESDYEDEILSDGEPPTYEEITPLM